VWLGGLPTRVGARGGGLGPGGQGRGRWPTWVAGRPLPDRDLPSTVSRADGEVRGLLRWPQKLIVEPTGEAFRQADNRLQQLASHAALVAVSSALRTLAWTLMKMANDVRWLASGPRTGIGELRIPENEPGSSIMPGKVNPTQSEAMTMVVTRVFGNDATVGFAGTQGNFQLNVFTPVMAHAVLESIRLLADASHSFTAHCMVGLDADRARIAANLDADLMLVTALAPHVGYDTAAAIAKQAHRDGSTLREAALASGAVTERDYDRWVDPEAMTHPD